MEFKKLAIKNFLSYFETNKIDLDDINLIVSDTDKPYIVVKLYKGKFRFITHALDKTTYEYYGHINDLYK